MIDTLRHGMNWLAEGMMQAWVTVEDRLWPRQRLVLLRRAEGYALHGEDGRAVVERLQLGGPAAEVVRHDAAVDR